MHGSLPRKTPRELEALRPAVARILSVQAENGAIAWFEKGPWDPWNHVECAMALTVMGELEAAGAAYDHLARTQRADGAWLGDYGNALPMVERDFISREPAPALVDSNFCAYPAVGVAHYLAATRDYTRVRGWWPMVRRALDFVLTLQHAEGWVSWSLEAQGSNEDDALLAGNASIAKSLECGLYLASELGAKVPHWSGGYDRLVAALRTKPELFDRRGTGARFAMDWYYPVLAGTLPLAEGRDRVARQWDMFVTPGQGCRCVCDEPWITVAETAELAMALVAVGDEGRARHLLESVMQHRDTDGAFWMGWQMEERIVWPREKPAWTQAAVILAADALREPDRACPLVGAALSLEASQQPQALDCPDLLVKA